MNRATFHRRKVTMPSWFRPSLVLDQDRKPWEEACNDSLPQPRFRYLAYLGAVVVFLFIAAFVAGTFHWLGAGLLPAFGRHALPADGASQSYQTSSEHPIPSCGGSAAEARALGCQFDLMSFTWTPPQCHDTDLEVEFMTTPAEETWRWYLDAQGDREVPIEQVREGELDHLFVTWEFHMTHCVFMWKKLHRAMLGGKMVDSYSWEYDHTRHCGMMILGSQDREWNVTHTEIRIKYAHCERPPALGTDVASESMI